MAQIKSDIIKPKTFFIFLTSFLLLFLTSFLCLTFFLAFFSYLKSNKDMSTYKNMITKT